MNTRLHTITRDPVFWVILPLALVIIPHLQRLPLWMPALIVLLFAVRLGAVIQPALMPRKFWLFVVAVFVSIGTVMHYGTLFGKAAGTAILICLLGIKLLESCSTRDYMLLIALSFFIIVTNFLFTQNIPTALFMLCTVVVLVMSLITLHQGSAALDLRWRLRAASRLVALAIPLMLVMFILFPRISGPLWHLPDDALSGRTGLSDTMTPGNIAQLIQSDELAFRVEFSSNKPAQDKLYWRALVLWQFDGRSWKPGKQNENTRPTLEGFGNPVGYTITLEPHDKTWLFALDMPKQVPANAQYNNNFLLRSKDKITSPYRYSLQSFLEYRIEYELSRWENNAGLTLPPDSNPRTVQLAQQWRTRFDNDEDIVRHALQQFNRQNYVYTLQPPPTLSANPVDEFLFESRRGFCEHYASSFTLLMRAAGIPARVVLGYQGGTVNPVNNVLTVRQSDAHAWSEVWLQNRGWVRVDPTAAIAPNRVERNLDSALGADEIRPLYMQIDNSVLRQMKFYWDAIDNRWKQWVIGYGPKLQQQLLQSLFNRDIHYSEMTFMLMTAIGAITLLLAWLSFRSKTIAETDPAQKLYNRFCKRLARQGVPRARSEGPLDFARRAAQQFPSQQPAIDLITKIYINSRYRSQVQADQIEKMKILIRKLDVSQNHSAAGAARKH
ncbi:MAG: protein-glutamine gamma-glutamyltransferase [Pseudomonadota bacterium]|nr:protein-glutamine gamma-glutamyltransferase [Pseudomonadota bacterium]